MCTSLAGYKRLSHVLTQVVVSDFVSRPNVVDSNPEHKLNMARDLFQHNSSTTVIPAKTREKKKRSHDTAE